MNKINIDGVIAPWNQDINELRNQLGEMSGDLLVEISSPGGSVWHGIELFNLLHNYEGQVTFRIGSIGASMGSYIPLSGAEIEVYDNTTYMIHNAWMYTGGDHIQLQHDADVLKGMTAMLRKQYVERTGRTEQEITDKMNAESYFFGQEIVDFGFADRLIESGNKEEKSAAVAVAKTAFKAMKAEVSSHEQADDVGQIAAYLKSEGVLMKQYENKPTPQEKSMDLSKVTAELLAEQRPDLVAALKEQGYKDGEAAGAKTEQARINALDGIKAVGHKNIIDTMKADITKTVNDAKLAIFDAQQEKMNGSASARAEDGKNLAQQAQELSGQPQKDGADDEAQAVANMEAAGKKARGEA